MDYEILDTIEEGREIYGSQSFDQALLELYELGRITHDTAIEHATNASDMKLKLQGIGLSSGNTDINSDEQAKKDIFDLKVTEEE